MSPHIVARRLGKAFGRKQVLEDVSLDVEPGDVVGVLGKNGAGKTTLIELILGFTPATCGTVTVFGHESFRLPGVAKKRVGFVPQQDELVEQLTGRDQLRLVASFYDDWDLKRIESLAREWEVDLAERVRNLSVGQRQKLSILLALGHQPDLLILDEPVASLDPIARRQFLEQLVGISADGERSVVFSSHIVSDIERLANKIWILKGGRVHWSGELDALKDAVVRVHIRGGAPLAADFSLPGALSMRRDGNHVAAVLSGWSAGAAAQVREQLGISVQVEVEVERLNLEEIFLELHR